jgi:ABC-type sugar transport system permease subunit
MIALLLTAVAWSIIGAIPGFYAFYSKRRDPRMGATYGALLGVAVGFIGLRLLGAVPSTSVAIIFIVAVWLTAGLLMPFGNYGDVATMPERIANLAYALLIPTATIVLGVVIFPLIWNIVFSVRNINVADLQNVNLYDFSDLTLENFQGQLGFRVDELPCEIDTESGECAVDEDGNTEYINPRRDFEDYRSYRVASEFDWQGAHYAIGVRDAEFYPMIFRSFFYTITGTLGAIIFGLAAAIIVRDEFPGRTVFRGFILFPYIAPVISVTFVWQALLRTNGFVNSAFGTDIAFLSTRDTWLGISIPLVMAIFFQIWRYFPFAFLFMLARLQAIPEDMYEAAKVDGASPSQRLWFITLPQLRAVFGTLFLLRFIWTFNKFDDIFLLTGPISQTKIIPVQIFEALFTNRNVGQASAIAVIMAFILAIVVFIYFRWFLVEEA